MIEAEKEVKNLVGISKLERKNADGSTPENIEQGKLDLKTNPMMRRMAMKFVQVADTTESEDELDFKNHC